MGDVINILNPKSIAVVGVSKNPQKVGHSIFKNLLNSKIKIFGVNPNAKIILGKKIYKNILEIKEKIDCVIIAVPAKAVYEIIKQSAKIKAKSIILISSGFSETGESKNKNLEFEIKKLCDRNKITLLGPNSFGIINSKEKINSTYFEKIPTEGTISFISQSGAIGSAVLDMGENLANFVSIGNSAQTDFSDFIEHFSEDKNTKVICAYMESLRENRGKRFIEICRKCKKPIVILKAGKSKQGQKAAMSHTSALATEEKIYKGAFKQAGIIEVDSIRQMFQVAKVIEKYPDCKFQRPAVVTNAGGLGVLTSDYLEENNIQIPELPKKLVEKLNKILPTFWSHNNPVDVAGSANAEDYKKTIQILERENLFDNFIILLTPQKMTEPEKTAREISKIKKPIVACFMGKEIIEPARKILEKEGIINFKSIKEMCDVLGRLS